MDSVEQGVKLGTGLLACWKIFINTTSKLLYFVIKTFAILIVLTALGGCYWLPETRPDCKRGQIPGALAWI